MQYIKHSNLKISRMEISISYILLKHLDFKLHKIAIPQNKGNEIRTALGIKKALKNNTLMLFLSLSKITMKSSKFT